MANQCSFCEKRHIPTNHLVLNDGELWIQFCAPCGEREMLTNDDTGETVSVSELFKRTDNETKLGSRTVRSSKINNVMLNRRAKALLKPPLDMSKAPIDTDPKLKALIEKEGNFLMYAESNFVCVISRYGNYGHLCGYLGVSPTMREVPSVAYGMECPPDWSWQDIPCHGGVSYNDNHPPKVDKNVFPNYSWVGFDCAHLNDICPDSTFSHDENATYKDMEYVKRELTYMIAYLLDVRTEEADDKPKTKKK